MSARKTEQIKSTLMRLLREACPDAVVTLAIGRTSFEVVLYSSGRKASLLSGAEKLAGSGSELEDYIKYIADRLMTLKNDPCREISVCP